MWVLFKTPRRKTELLAYTVHQDEKKRLARSEKPEATKRLAGSSVGANT